MMAGVRRTAATAGALIVIAWSVGGEAHKPITSPFTFNEDVLPIVREQCATCHAPGGVAPMSLLTHADAVPWGESIRTELMAGHMPPWPVETAADRFRNVQRLTARQLNVILTWASGGTPSGDPKTETPVAAHPGWALGAPDVVLPLPEVSLSADEQERVAEFTLPASTADRDFRAVDLLPGTPAIVRQAVVAMKSAAATAGMTEQILALWVPGDHAVPSDAGMALHVPAGAELVARVTYRKTWEYERRPMRDRSSVGLYLAQSPSQAVEALPLTVATTVVDRPLRAISIYPDPGFGNARVKVMATRPDGSREELITFRPRPGWAGRYWFREPIALPRGTRIEMTTSDGEEALLPPAATPVRRVASSPARLVLNVIPSN